MKLMACDAREAYQTKHRCARTRWIDVLMDFKNSSDTCVQILDYEHVDARCCAWDITRAIRINHL